MFNVEKINKSSLVQHKNVFFSNRSCNSIVNRFLNFTFNGPNKYNTNVMYDYYTKIVGSLNFTSRRSIMGFKCNFNIQVKQFSWLFLYMWSVKLVSGSCKVKYRKNRFKSLGTSIEFTKYMYPIYRFKFRELYSYNYPKLYPRSNWARNRSKKLEFLFFSKLVYGRLYNSKRIVLISNKINYDYWSPLFTKDIGKVCIYRYDLPFKITTSMYFKDDFTYKKGALSIGSKSCSSVLLDKTPVGGISILKKLKTKGISTFYRRNKLLTKFMLIFTLLVIKNNANQFNSFAEKQLGSFLRGDLFNSKTIASVVTDTSLLLIRCIYSRKFSFNDMIPCNYMYSLLILSKNRIAPFAIRNKTFISQREVHFSSVCFFIERGSLIRKNSYFLGLVIGGLREKNFTLTKVYKLLNYSFYKNPYSLNSKFSWLN